MGKQHKKCVFVGCAISHPGIARSWPCDFYCFVSLVDGFGGTFIGWCFSLTIGLNLSSVHHSHHVPWRWKGWIVGWKMMDAISCFFSFCARIVSTIFLGMCFWWWFLWVFDFACCVACYLNWIWDLHSCEAEMYRSPKHPKNLGT